MMGILIKRIYSTGVVMAREKKIEKFSTIGVHHIYISTRLS